MLLITIMCCLALMLWQGAHLTTKQSKCMACKCICSCRLCCRCIVTSLHWSFSIFFLLTAPQGPWKQREIPNPAYFKVDNPLELLSPVAGVAFELWTTDPGYIFDSVLLGSGEAGIAAAAAYMKDTWRRRNHAEVRVVRSAVQVLRISSTSSG